MTSLRWLGLLSLLSIAAVGLEACGTAPSHPDSLVSAAGQTGLGGRVGQSTAGAPGRSGAGSASGGEAGDGGAPGEAMGTPQRPLALYPSEVAVNAACGAPAPDAVVLIQNGGAVELSIVSASANAGYVVSSKLPLYIASGAGAQLLITPPAPKASAQVGDMTRGTLSFTSNEPGEPVHTVSLNTELLGARLEFTDHAGAPLNAGLTLSYLNDAACPDTLKYRVHNTGNVAFNLFGPTFPAHLAGSTTGPSGQSIVPDGYVELTVGGNSSPGDACNASGQLAFSAKGAFCGNVPTLNVVWPAPARASCACSATP